MPAILDSTQVGKKEFRLGVIFLADNLETPFLSAAHKPASSYSNEKTGIPNMLGTYQLKTRGERKAVGVADGRDVGAYDADPPRDELAFRAMKVRRAPKVGEIAEGNDVAGIKSEMAEAVANQSVNLKRDIEFHFLGDAESSANGGFEGGSVTRSLGRTINAGELAITDPNCPIPANIRTPAGQVYTGTYGDGINTGLTQDVVQGTLKERWERTGDTGQLMGFVGTMIQDRFSKFSTYVPDVSGASPIVRTEREGYGTGVFMAPYVDVYKSGPYGAFALLPVATQFLPDAYRAYFLDMSQVMIRSRYWFKEHPLPDMDGGPRKAIKCLVALIGGDPRSHVKYAATP